LKVVFDFIGRLKLSRRICAPPPLQRRKSTPPAPPNKTEKKIQEEEYPIFKPAISSDFQLAAHKRNLVVILEDADAAVMTRSSDNQEQVSALLNLSDGMLGDFLALQIVCTINCTAAEIDQALLRPGRLITHKVFERLDPDHAERLASSLGTKLPQARDYSLAEIFAGKPQIVARPSVGFA